jgi:hypothetical protein
MSEPRRRDAPDLSDLDDIARMQAIVIRWIGKGER